MREYQSTWKIPSQFPFNPVPLFSEERESCRGCERFSAFTVTFAREVKSLSRKRLEHRLLIEAIAAAHKDVLIERSERDSTPMNLVGIAMTVNETFSSKQKDTDSMTRNVSAVSVPAKYSTLLRRSYQE
jgi:hypothetical protein